MYQQFLDKGYDVPDFVKVASENEPTLFAYNDGIGTHFPIDTPKNAWLSMAGIEKVAQLVPANKVAYVTSLIKEACEFHKIGEITQTIVKTASETEEFTKYASEVINFERHYQGRRPSSRRSIAKELMERRKYLMEASEKEIPSSPIIERYAGDDLSPDWKEHIHNRIRLIAHKPEIRKDYEDLLESEDEIQNHERPEEVAQAVEHLDNKHGLNAQWDEGIKDPFFSMLANHPKGPLTIIVMHSGGKHFTPEHFEGLKREDLDLKLDKDIVDEVFNKKNESLDHMPDFVKNIIAGLVNAQSR